MATAGVAPYDPNDPNNPLNYQLQTSPYGALTPGGTPSGEGYNYSPYTGAGGGNQGNSSDPDTSTFNATYSGNEADVNPNASIQDINAANRDTINTTGNLIGQEAGNQLNYYGSMAVDQGAAQNAALNQLATTPGYTAAQAQGITGDPNAPLTAVSQYGTALQGDVSGLQTGVTGAASGEQSGLNTAATGEQQGLNAAVTNEGQGLTAAQGAFDPLNTAVNNSNLGVSDQDVQNLTTAAGTTVGNQFGTAEDTLRQQAAAAGNTSPAAEAAMRQQLVTQEAATAGDTMTQAQIAAKQYQLSALQQQTGLQATAATTEEAAAQAAAATEGTAEQNAAATGGAAAANAAATGGAAQQSAAATGGTAAIGAENTYGALDTSALQTAEQEASSRATTEANQAIAGQTAYRSGVAGQQQLAQGGQSTADTTQNQAYGTQTAGANTSASGQENYLVGQNSNSFGTALAKSTANAIGGLFEKGGVADEDTVAKVAEHGPEMVVNMGRYKSNRKMDEMEEDGRFRIAA